MSKIRTHNLKGEDALNHSPPGKCFDAVLNVILSPTVAFVDYASSIFYHLRHQGHEAARPLYNASPRRRNFSIYVPQENFSFHLLTYTKHEETLLLTFLEDLIPGIFALV